jgi:hypothetical protein
MREVVFKALPNLTPAFTQARQVQPHGPLWRTAASTFESRGCR